MESFFSNLPFHLNPITSIGIQLALAYIPHFMKGKVAADKLKAEGKKKDLPGSRQQYVELSDSTPSGRYIATLNGAHINGLEALSYHSIAVLCAIVTGVPSQVISGAAAIFILARIAYLVIYITPSLNGILRSLSFLVAIITDVILITLASQYYPMK